MSNRSTASAARMLALPALAAALTSVLPSDVAAQDAEEAEAEEVIVEATRAGRRVQDEPVRVEVIGREEIEEKITMRPGNVAMLLSETGGLRVQVTSPALGAANIRVQGMRGRYTQLLSDGLPLYGGQATSIGLLQIPPTDLGQVEVIKGAASALYGPSALGGVINLVSRRPGPAAEAEFLANVTSRDGQDLTAYAAAPLSGGWSGSLTGGLHRQTRQDLDDDGWADMPGYDRWTVRPRLFWTGDSGATAYLTAGAVGETRRGGTLSGRVTPDGSAFRQDQRTRRYDAGAVLKTPLEGAGLLSLRGSAVRQDHRHRFGGLREDDRHETALAEASLSGVTGATAWLGGLAIQRDAYRAETFADFDYTHTAPAVFAQAEHDLREDLVVAASARLDAHSDYGTRLSPRISILYKPGRWTVRASAGQGFFAPTPFVEEIEAAGLSRLEPLGDIKAEVARSAALDAGYRRGPLEANLTLFASSIEDAVQLMPAAADRVRLVNLPGKTLTRGAEALLRYRWEELTVTGSYVYVDTREPDPAGGRRETPLTPHHSAGVVAIWEREDWGRVGVEAYYTGRQHLDDDPYRTTSRPYVELGLLAERRFGAYSVFLNLENLLNVRQTKTAPLVRPRRAPDGRWTVDAWAPTEGFVANVGVRMRLGGD